MLIAVLKKKWLIVLVATIVIAAICLSITCGGVASVFAGKQNKKLPIYRVGTDEKKIAISFDCAWGVDYTDKLLDIMKEEKIKCTFFMVEFWTLKYPEYVKKIADAGHEIGTHSATHPYMSRLEKPAIERELTSSSLAIENLIDKKVELFRPPYGDYDDLLIETATELGLYTIQWDVDSLDWKDLSATEIKNRVTSRVKNGSIVLFHNQGKHTAEALPLIIQELKSNGYTFLPIGELIYRNDYQIAVDGTQIHV